MSAIADPVGKDPFAVVLDAEGLKRRTLHGSLVTAASQGIRLVLQVGSQVVLARLLFPEDFGLLAMVYPIVALVQVFNDLGFGQAIVQRPTLEQARVSALLWVNLAISILLAVVVALLAPVAAWAYGEPRVLGLMIVLALVLPIGALGVHPSALLSRQMRFGVIGRNETLGSFVGIAVTIASALAGLSYWSLVIGQVAGLVLGNALNWVSCGWRPSRPRFVQSAWADLRFGGNVTGANLATYVTVSSDNVIIGLMNGKAALGLYDRSYRLVVQPLGQLFMPISRVAVPLLSRLVDRPDEYRQAYLNIFRVLLVLAMPLMLVCITNGDVVIHLFLGPRWDAAAVIFSWICVGGLTSGINASASWLFISQGRTQAMVKYLTAASAINLASFFVGAIFGIVWVAAVGASSFVLVTTPLVLYGGTRSSPVEFRDLVRTALPVVAETALVFAVLVLQKRAGLTGLGQLALASLIALVGFTAGAALIGSQRRLLLGLKRIGLAGLRPGSAAA